MTLRSPYGSYHDRWIDGQTDDRRTDDHVVYAAQSAVVDQVTFDTNDKVNCLFLPSLITLQQMSSEVNTHSERERERERERESERERGR